MYYKLNRVFHAMIERCYKPNNKQYKDYGGRGIKICEEWCNPEIIKVPGIKRITKGFNAFKQWALSNGYIDGLTIDRIDNNKGYSPENCRWVTRKEQQNNIRTNHLITYKGKTQTMAQWCDELHLKYNTINTRLNHYHWSVERALETKGNSVLKNITYKGKTQSLTDWSRELGIKYSTLSARLNDYKWTVERAFETKAQINIKGVNV